MSLSVKAVTRNNDTSQSWRAWAASKIGRGARAQQNNENDMITLFPGWAVRKYNHALKHQEPAPFEVEAFVSGYAISCKPKEQASRSQRAFIRLAKGFASLPRLDAQDVRVQNQNQLPEAYQAQLIDEQLQRAKTRQDSESDSEPDSYETTPAPRNVTTTYDLLQKLHHNLESRLQLFWSSTLPSRTIRLHLFASPHHSSPDLISTEGGNPLTEDHKPLATKDVTTTVDGSFNARFHVKWDDLCHHPKTLHIAFDQPVQEHDLLIIAELLPPPISRSSSSSSLSNSNAIPSHYPSSTPNYHPHIQNLLNTLPSLKSLASLISPTSTASAHIRIPITHSPIRVISDIDDTVKLSSVTEGARAVFHNVFVKELKDGVIPGMGEWYTDMWKKGVRFHYVSNGPYEYLRILYEFFTISKLPPGSIKLKSYAGRSLLSGLLSTPAGRKRAGIVEILDSFEEGTKFILIGDSGEQDLELYADLARERPGRVLAVFIRDAEESLYPPIDDPTGWSVLLPGVGNVYRGGTGTGTGTGTVVQGPLYNSPKQTVLEPRWVASGNTEIETEHGSEAETEVETKTPKQKDVNIFKRDTESESELETPVQTNNHDTITIPNSAHTQYITRPPPPIIPLTISSSSSGSISMSSSSNNIVNRSWSTGGNGNGGRNSKYAGVGMDDPSMNENVNQGQFQPQLQYQYQPAHQPQYQPQPQPQLPSSRGHKLAASMRSLSGSISGLVYGSGSGSNISHRSGSGNGNGGGNGNGQSEYVAYQPRTSQESSSSSSSLDPSSIWWGSGLEQGVGVNVQGSGSSIGQGQGQGQGRGNGNLYSGQYDNNTSAGPDAGSTGSNGSIGSGGSGGSVNVDVKMTEKERKRFDLQERVYRARTQMPSKITLRVFREPAECFDDVEKILGTDSDSGNKDGDVGLGLNLSGGDA